MTVKLKNNAFSIVPLAVLANATNLTVTFGEGSKFPALSSGEYFYATLSDISGAYEIVKVTARVGDSMTIVRGQEGTIAIPFTANSRIELRINVANVEGGTYTASGSGVVARTLQVKLREQISVEDFGAVGDGITDDTTAIQAALNALTAGDTLVFQNNYKVTASLTITDKSRIRLTGKGRVFLSGAASNAYIFQLVGTCDEIEIDSMTLAGDNNAAYKQTAIGCNSGQTISNTRFHDLNISNINVGISHNANLSGSWTKGFCYSNSLKNISGTVSGSGYGIQMAKATQITVTENVLDNCGRHSIYQGAGQNCNNLIANNVIVNHRSTVGDGSFRAAAVIARSSDVTFTGNKFYNCYDCCLEIAHVTSDSVNCSNILVEGNTFTNRGNAVHTILIGEQAVPTSYFTKNITIKNNQFDDDLSVTPLLPPNIYILQGKDIVIEGNKFTRNNVTSSLSEAILLGNNLYIGASTDLNDVVIRNNVGISDANTGVAGFVSVCSDVCVGTSRYEVSENSQKNWTRTIYFESLPTLPSNPNSYFGGYINAKEFGAVGDDSTLNTTVIQTLLNSLTTGGTLYFPRGIYRSTSLDVNNANTRIELDEGAVLKFPTLGVGVSGLTVNANNFSVKGGKLQGPAASVYVAGERGISMVGTSSASRKTGLKLYNVEITQFGMDGVYAKWTDDIVLDGCKIHYCGYSGASFLSCNHGVATKNQFLNITPGTSGNMYGISLTHNSALYVLDPNAGTKQADNPFCWDWYIGHNYVAYNAWEGIDCHGGYEITIDSNKVYATYGGIACSSSSGDAAGYAGWDNAVINNIVDARNPDGTASTYENDNYGINLNGGSTLNHKNVICKGNIVINHGILGNTNSGAIQAVYVQNATITENIIQKWGGSCIIGTASSSLIISKNTFLELGGAAAGAENAIMIETTSSLGNTITITDNSMQANGGTAGLVGVRAPQLTTLPYFAGNDFAVASSAPYVVPNAFLVSDVSSPILRVDVNNAGGGAAVNVDVAALSRYPTFRIDVTSSNAASEISNFTNGVYGQVIHIHSPSATAFVLNTTAKRLSGGSAFTASQWDIISLLQTGNGTGVGGIFWTEISRSVNA